MIGRTISHYSILEKLGEGGMGVVYKARDTHLDRFVAIKVLPPEKVTDPERRRRFTLAASHLFGPGVAGGFSALMALALMSTVNAMVTIGRRLYYAMAPGSARDEGRRRTSAAGEGPLQPVLEQPGGAGPSESQATNPAYAGIPAIR